VVRAYLAHAHDLPTPIKTYYVGHHFRLGRPQAGRFREFRQFGVEIVGIGGPEADVEVLALGERFARERGLRAYALHLNSIGDEQCRPAYREELIRYFEPYLDQLDEDCRVRLGKNPLRVFDCKVDGRKDFVLAAPTIVDHLCGPCSEHFAAVRSGLDEAGVRYELDPRLVRGLDYYTRTAFEFYIAGREGQQQALGGGGRYDGLVELLGGKPTPGIGFGIGLDRLVLALEEQGRGGSQVEAPTAVVVGADPDDTVTRLRVATILREAGLVARAELTRRKLGKQLESAARDGAHFAVIVGDELTAGEVQVRDLPAGSQKVVALADLPRELARAHAAHRHGIDAG